MKTNPAAARRTKPDWFKASTPENSLKAHEGFSPWKKPRTKPVGRRMWAATEPRFAIINGSEDRTFTSGCYVPVLVLPLDTENLERIREELLEAWSQPDSFQAILRKFGLTPTKRKKK